MSAQSPHKSSAAPLWAAYHATRSDADRNALVAHYLPMVERAAERMRKRLPRAVQVGDLVQWGCNGLIQAVQGFDPARGHAFSTYAGRRITGAMIDGLRAAADRSRIQMERAKALATAEAALRCELGRQPSPEETAAKLGWDHDKFRARAALRYVQNRSLSTEMQSLYGEPLPVGDLLPDRRANDPAVAAERRDFADQVIKYLLANVGLTAAFAVRFYFLEGMTMGEIATILRRTPSRISQILTGVLARLQREYVAA